MEIETLLSNLCGTILLYFVPYVVVRLIHRRSFSLKAAKIMTIVWAIVSAAIVVAIKFATGATSPTGTRGLNVAAIFIWHGFGYYVLLTESKREKANHNSTPTAEPQTLINGEPWRDPETKAETYNPAPESSVAADPYNVDDVEVNIVKPKYATTHTTDRKTKIAFICMAIAIVLAVISAGVAISKNAECNQLKSEKVDIQRSLKSVNEQYDELLAHYNTVAEENEQAFINNNEYVLELTFYQRYAVCTNGGKYYHKYSCPRFDENKTFWIYNTEAAESDGFRPCPECIE
jgi:hypothetical protein